MRELRNIAERVVLGVHKPVMGEIAGPTAEAAVSLVDTVESFERGLIAAELSRNDGNVARSAKALNIAKTTLADKIRKYQLHRVASSAVADVDFGGLEPVEPELAHDAGDQTAAPSGASACSCRTGSRSGRRRSRRCGSGRRAPG